MDKDELPLDTNIDVSLSMLDGTHMDEFMKELKAVSDNMQGMVDNLKSLADSFAELKDTTGGHGNASGFNRHPESGDSGSTDTPTGASSGEQVEQERPRENPQEAQYPGGREPVTYVPGSMREIFENARARADLSSHPLSAVTTGAGAIIDTYRHKKYGGKTPYNPVDPENQGSLLGGEDFMDENPDQGSIFDPEMFPGDFKPFMELPKPSMKNRVRTLLTEARNTVTRFGNKPAGEDDGEFFGDGALPKLALVTNAANTFSNMRIARRLAGANEGETSREYMGSEMGYSTQGGEVEIPGTNFGFRMPFMNPASRHMLGEKFEKLKYRAQAGLNKEQTDEVFGAGYANGFVGGDATDVYRNAMGNMMKDNPALAHTDQYQTMLANTIRFGATSVEDFNRIMRQVPQAAKSAGMSVEEFTNGIANLYASTKDSGQTQLNAAQFATTFAGNTKMGPQEASAIANSPLYTSVAYQQTGVLPFAQGQLSGQRQAQIAADTVFQFADMMPNLPAQKVTDDAGGYQIIGSTQQKASLIAQQLGIPEEQVADMLRRRKDITNLNKASTRLGTMKSELLRAKKTGDKELEKKVLTKGKEGIDHTDDITTWAEVNEAMQAKGQDGKPIFSKKERAEIFDAGKSDDPVKKIEERMAKFEAIKQRHNEKENARGGDTGTVKIDLTDAAKKLVSVMEPAVPMYKAAANAGEGLTNDMFGRSRTP